MSDLTDAIYEIEKAVETISAAADNQPAIDKDELESRLTDLEAQVRSLTELGWTELPDAIESLASEIHELYTEV